MYQTIISPMDAENIRTMYARGPLTMKELGKRFNVSPSTICRIIHGQRQARKRI
jgi:hypothetical protein